MPQNDGLNRRTLLKQAGMSAVAGAMASGTPSAAQSAPAASETAGMSYDFDTVYSRVGTDSVKWDAQIARYGKDSIVAGMGVADMDFRCAPVITDALKDRIAHENWGLSDDPEIVWRTHRKVEPGTARDRDQSGQSGIHNGRPSRPRRGA
jgi:hypothetical protein